MVDSELYRPINIKTLQTSEGNPPAVQETTSNTDHDLFVDESAEQVGAAVEVEYLENDNIDIKPLDTISDPENTDKFCDENTFREVDIRRVKYARYSNNYCLLCKSSYTHDSSLSLFRFPAEAVRRRVWKQLCGFKDKLLKGHERLCQKHFPKNYFKASKRGELDEIITLLSSVSYKIS